MNNTPRQNQSVQQQQSAGGHTGEPAATIISVSDQELYERIARKAYELFQQRGEVPGHDVDDWLAAEQLVNEELLHGPVPEPPIEEDDYPDQDDSV